jgi:hypothetical protein
MSIINRASIYKMDINKYINKYIQLNLNSVMGYICKTKSNMKKLNYIYMTIKNT